MLSRVIFLGILHLSRNANATLESANCSNEKPFFCPNNCKISWSNGCPVLCTCYPPRYCPETKCPAPTPICIILTQVNNCQTCLCNQPVIEIKITSANPNDTDFVLIGKRRFTSERQSKCSKRQTKNVDQCWQKFAWDLASAKEELGSGLNTFNPLVELHRRGLNKVCDSYDDSLRCSGEKLFTDCSTSHFFLTKINAFYGYACGPKRNVFLLHYPCILEAHKSLRRLKLCENLLASSFLELFANFTISHKGYVERKCEGLKWFAACVKPDIYSFCSRDAAETYVEAIHSMASFIEPECQAHKINLTAYFSHGNDTDYDKTVENQAKVSTTDFGTEKLDINDNQRVKKSLDAQKLNRNFNDDPLTSKLLVQSNDDEATENLTKIRDTFLKTSKFHVKIVSITIVGNSSAEIIPKDVDSLSANDDEIFPSAEAKLAKKDQPRCMVDFRREINAKFSYFLYEIRNFEQEPTFSTVYPSIFSFSTQIIDEKCSEFRSALAELSSAVKTACLGQYDVYDQVYNTLFYPCSDDNAAQFRKHFDCLTESRRRDVDVQQCEQQASEFARDPSADRCHSHMLFAQCVHRPTARLCGPGGWLSLFRLLNFTVVGVVGKQCLLPYTPDGVEITPA